MEKWYEIKKGADFQAIAERFGISPVTARLIRNRGVIGDAAIDKYLNGTCRDLYDPHLLYESEKLVCILSEKIRQGRPIRIIGDYDIDGVMSTIFCIRGSHDAAAVCPARFPTACVTATASTSI